MPKLTEKELCKLFISLLCLARKLSDVSLADQLDKSVAQLSEHIKAMESESREMRGVILDQCNTCHNAGLEERDCFGCRVKSYRDAANTREG